MAAPIKYAVTRSKTTVANNPPTTTAHNTYATISVAIPSEVANYMKSGALQSVALWDPAISAKVMLNVGMKLWAGETISTGDNLGEEGYGSVNVDGTLIMGEGWIAITPDNVDSFTF